MWWWITAGVVALLLVAAFVHFLARWDASVCAGFDGKEP
jgi:hypothetical protein